MEEVQSVSENQEKNLDFSRNVQG